jgi:antirestriction protein ArdC
MKNAELHKAVADKVIAAMETNGTDWLKPWCVPANQQPTSMSTNKGYAGINWLILSMERAIHGYTSNQWATYKQWFKMGGGVDEWVSVPGKKKKQRNIITPSKYNVKANETGTQVVYFKNINVEDKETGEAKTVPFMRVYHVFNADQVSGYVDTSDNGLPAAPVYSDPSAIVDTVDQYANATGITIKNADKSSAFYSSKHDFVNMPEASQFTTPEGYSATLLHELTHATGHTSRLNRNLKNKFGSKDYAFEELIAELGSAMLCGSLSICMEPRDDHAKYLNGWMQRLREKPDLIFKAAAAAQKAATFLDAAAEQGRPTDIALAA